MGKHKIEEDPPPSTPLWMCSYADLMGLLLCFFIVLFAFSSPNELKFGMAAKSLRDAFGIFSSQKNKPFNPPVVDPKLLEQGNEKERLVKLADYLRNYLKKNDYSNYVNIIPHKNTIKLRINGSFLFDEESDIVTNKAFPLLNEISNCGVFLKDSEIKIEAHTNNIPLTKGRFKSDWELSVGRSARIVEYFQSDKKINSSRLSAVAFGASRSLFPNDTAFQRNANNRVEIIFFFTNLE